MGDTSFLTWMWEPGRRFVSINESGQWLTFYAGHQGRLWMIRLYLGLWRTCFEVALRWVQPEPCRACGAPVLESADLCTNGHTAIGLLRFLEKNAACVHYEGAMGAGDIHPIMREIWEADAETQMQARSKDAA